MRFARCQANTYRQAVGIDEGMDLTGQTAPRSADILVSIVRGTGPVLMHADDGGVDHLNHGVVSGGHRLHDLVPDPCQSPAHETVITGCAGTIAFRQISPRCTRAQYPKDAVRNPSIIHTPDTPWFVREHRPDKTPFIVAEFVPHDSILQFGSLNHDQRERSKDEPRCPSLCRYRTYGG